MLAFEQPHKKARECAIVVDYKEDDNEAYHDPINVRQNMPDKGTPKSAVKGKNECKAQDPDNCPYHGTGKYAKAPMDLSNVTDWFNGMFVENDIKPENVKIEASPTKKGRMEFKVVVDPKFKWRYFDTMKANLMHNRKGIALYDLMRYERKSHTFVGRFDVKGFVTTSKGEKDLETADKNAKGKKPVVVPKKGKEQAKAKPSAQPKPTPPTRRKAQDALARQKAAKTVKGNGGQPIAKTSKDRIVAALRKAKAKKVFAKVNAKRKAKGTDNK